MLLLRVLLVEDHPLLQQAIQALLAPHCTIVGVVGNAERLTADIDETRPDVLVLDVSLPGRSGLQVLPYVRRTFPQLGIVIATNHPHPEYREEAMKRGADVFLLKDQLQQHLWGAVQKAVLRGGAAFEKFSNWKRD